MFRGGAKNKKEAKVVADHAREEVLFWKRELDDAVEEKNAWKQRFYQAYRELGAKEEVLTQLQQQHNDLQAVLDQTLEDAPHTAQAEAAGSTASANGAAAGAASAAAAKQSGGAAQERPPPSSDVLGVVRAKLKAADGRIALLEEHLASLQQDNRTLTKQNELLRASEGAFQREAKQLREELRKQCGINELTANETSKLLLDNSRVAQANAALQGDVAHKDEMIRLLQSQLSELSAKLDTAGTSVLNTSLSKSMNGLPLGWELASQSEGPRAARALQAK